MTQNCYFTNQSGQTHYHFVWPNNVKCLESTTGNLTLSLESLSKEVVGGALLTPSDGLNLWFDLAQVKDLSYLFWDLAFPFLQTAFLCSCFSTKSKLSNSVKICYENIKCPLTFTATVIQEINTGGISHSEGTVWKLGGGLGTDRLPLCHLYSEWTLTQDEQTHDVGRIVMLWASWIYFLKQG